MIDDTVIERRKVEAFRYGPERVVVNEDGQAVSWKRAFRDHGVTPRVIFMRDDGWTLGAPPRLERVAYSLWSDQWALFVRAPGKDWLPIEEYDGYGVGHTCPGCGEFGEFVGTGVRRGKFVHRYECRAKKPWVRWETRIRGATWKELFASIFGESFHPTVIEFHGGTSDG